MLLKNKENFHFTYESKVVFLWLQNRNLKEQLVIGSAINENI